jgi:hypothetical protein
MPKAISVAIFLLLSFVASAADLPKPDVPDPIGLGERLALIDHLRSELKVQPPDDATLDALIELYWLSRGPEALAKARGVHFEDIPDTEADRVVRIDRLRRELGQRFNFHATGDMTEEQLIKELQRLRGEVEAEQMAAMGAVNKAEQVQARAEEVAKAVEEQAEAGTVAANPARGSSKEEYWQEELAAAWKQLEELPATWDARWLGKGKPADDAKGRYKVKRADGTIEYLENKPEANEDIVEAWLLRHSSDPNNDMISQRWQPMSWIQENNYWIPEGPEIFRWSREEPYGEKWIGVLLAKPGVSEGTDGKWYVANVEWKKAEAIKAVVGDASGIEPARAKVAEILAAASAELGIDDLTPIHADIHNFARDLVEFCRFSIAVTGKIHPDIYEGGVTITTFSVGDGGDISSTSDPKPVETPAISAYKGGNDEALAEWKKRAQEMMKRNEARRAMMRAVMEKMEK